MTQPEPVGREQALHAADERVRLAALDSYAVLDTPAEQGFDDIVLLASRICQTPVALVSLVTDERQWFKAKVGFDGCQTPLAQSVCIHALRQPGLLVIPDLMQDPRTKANTLVTGAPHIRFYAGARLETPDGVALGTLCVIDVVTRPEGLSAEQASSLEALARQVMTQMELRRAAFEKTLLVQEAHHRVKNSLQMVQTLLSLQARTAVYPEAAEQLRASAGRVRAFGAMHEHLYRVGAAVQVDLAEYLANLVTHQREGLASTLEGRSISFEAARALWPSADAPSVGLIVMELVTNALKYGQGQVRVTLRQGDGGIVLRVEDEGRLAEDFDPSQSKGLGMRILSGLLQGQRGRLEIDRTRDHTCFIATLRQPPAKIGPDPKAR
jgi:two-component sensor histidine kinase